MKKKILSLGLATIVLASTVACSDPSEKQDAKLQENKQEVDSKYKAHSGNLIELSSEDASIYITINDEKQESDYDIIKFNVSDDTYILDDKTQDFIDVKELKEGMAVEALYKKDSPMTRSIPPMTNAKSVIIRNEDESNKLGIKIDTFDKDFISSDNFLQLNITKDTVIVDESGKELEKEDMLNKESIVFYGPAMTMSIPGQSKAVKIIVLEISN